MVRPRKQTGPTRAAVRHNALTHGLRTADVIIAGEHRQHWRHFHDLVISELAPATPIQRELASHIATIFWRLRRVPRAESWLTGIKDDDKNAMFAEFEMISRQIFDDIKASEIGEPFKPNEAYAPAAEPRTEPPGHPISHLMVPVEHALDRLVRYENHLYRQLYRAMDRLRRMQFPRRRAADDEPE